MKHHIEPNTKIKILSREHSEYVQKLAFECGFEWGSKGREFSHLDSESLCFCSSKRISHGAIKDIPLGLKEIFIDMPDEPTVEVRLISEKFKPSASDVLTAGAKHLQDRASTYDKPEGERSMAATVAAFNSITGSKLTEEQGWMFMVLLKAVRSQQGNYKLDNYEDGAAYFALMAEAASNSR